MNKVEGEYKKIVKNALITTKIDLFVEELNKKNEILLEDIYKKYKWDKEITDEILSVLEKNSWCKIVYPINVMEKPKVVKQKRFVRKGISSVKKGTLVECYNCEDEITKAKIPVCIEYVKNEGYRYIILLPTVQDPTKDFLKYLNDVKLLSWRVAFLEQIPRHNNLFW